MADRLKDYFPMIRKREELLCEIQSDKALSNLYEQLGPRMQEEFLNFCTGMVGAKILRDSFFKEVLNPEYAPERLEDFLSTLLKRKVKILNILPSDSTRIADMLLRQYRRVRAKQGKHFTYNQIKNVYLIVIYEKSPQEFKEFPEIYYHHAKQKFDSGLELDLLQEYIMIPLDIYHKRTDNKPIETPLEAWLTFLSDDRPEKIIELITRYPQFKAMYETLYQMCVNVEKVMNMFFSEELRILDRNTVQYMMDEQQKEIDEQKKVMKEQADEIARLKEELESLRKEK